MVESAWTTTAYVPSKIQIHSKNSNIISILSIGIVQSIQLRLL